MILFALVALGVVALYGKYGRKVGGNVHESGKRVETLGDEQGGRPSSSSAGAGGSETSAVSGSSSSADALPEPVAAGGAGKNVDTRTVILLGIVVLAVGALMILSIFQRVRKAQKKARLQR